jgi:tetratricopeptide (TPR) repeat protein
MHTFLLIALLATGPLAQAELDDARAAVDAATSEYDLGHYKESLAHFEKAYKLRHIPALLFNIAQCHRMLGELKEAAAVYRNFLIKDPQNSRVEQAKTLLAQIEDALGRQAQAQNAPPVELSSRPEPQASADPFAPKPMQPVAVPEEPPPPPAQPSPWTAPKQTEPEATKLRPAAPPAAVEAAATGKKRVFTWVAGGAGVLGLAVGGAFGLQSRGAQSDLQSQHTGAEVLDLQKKQVDNANRANTFFVVGAATLAVAAALYFLEL